MTFSFIVTPLYDGLSLRRTGLVVVARLFCSSACLFFRPCLPFPLTTRAATVCTPPSRVPPQQPRRLLPSSAYSTPTTHRSARGHPRSPGFRRPRTHHQSFAG